MPKGAPEPYQRPAVLPSQRNADAPMPKFERIAEPASIVEARKKAEEKAKRKALPAYHPSIKGKLTPTEQLYHQFKALLPGHRPPKVKGEQLSIFTRQFAAMLDAGIPLHRALTFFAESGETNDLTRVIDQVGVSVSAGSRLSVAMRMHPYVFSEVYCSLVETGEQSGQLLMVLNRLAEILEKQVTMQKRLIATLTYPLILMAVSGASIFTFVVFILPMIEPIFISLKVALPWPTKMLLMSRSLLLPLVLGTLAAAAGLWLSQPWVRKFLSLQPDIQLALSRTPLRLPIIGHVLYKIAVSRILFSLASMIDSGMGMVPAIQRSSVVAGNRWITHRMNLAKVEIMEGSLVSEAFARHEVFPNAAIHIIGVGEETSSISDMTRYAALMFDEEAELALASMAAMLEPLIMGFMGIIVGFIVLASILPTLQLINNL